MRTLKLFNIFVISILYANNAFGQSPDMKSTLEFVNQELGVDFKVSVEKGYLSVQFYKDGELFREDEAACKDLDVNKIGYDSAEKMFSLNCITGRDCVIRVYNIREIRRDYGRISFSKQLSEKQVTSLTAAFRHIIKMVNDTKYKDQITLP